MSDLALHGGAPIRSTPFPQRQPYGEDDLREVREALESQDLFCTSGNKIAALEREFAATYNTRHALACSSGTAAVHMAIAALNADPGGEVITAPVTDFGSIAGIIFQGLIPVFADWKENTFSSDPDSIERLITERTRAIMAVHLFGNPCNMDAILKIAQKHDLPVIEDCAQAYCTKYRGRFVGTFGDMATFSMQQSKHLPTGEGGLTITNNDDYAMRMGLFRDKGWENRGRWGARSYTFLGVNYRMNELTGAVARAQLRKVQHVVDVMHRLGDLLTEQIRDVSGILPCPVQEGAEHSYWLYAFKVTGCDPQEFVKALKAEGIPAAWGYTVNPIYLCTDALTKQRTFGTTSYPFDSHYYSGQVEYKEGLCPVAERELKQIGTLRIFENWSEADISDVARAFRKVAAGLQRVDASTK